MRFPKQEPLIAALANAIATGLTNNTEDFPSPPVSPDQLREALAPRGLLARCRHGSRVGGHSLRSGTWFRGGLQGDSRQQGRRKHAEPHYHHPVVRSLEV